MNDFEEITILIVILVAGFLIGHNYGRQSKISELQARQINAIDKALQDLVDKPPYQLSCPEVKISADTAYNLGWLELTNGKLPDAKRWLKPICEQVGFVEMDLD